MDPGSGSGRVVTWDGHTVWRVRVAPSERTCLRCGDTFDGGGYCIRCAHRSESVRRNPPPSVATVSYLRDDEYETI
jgi:hypothetical protein